MPDSLLTRTSKAIYRADEAPKRSDWSNLPRTEQRRYEVMAAAALSIILQEPVEPVYLPDDMQPASTPS